MGQRLSNVSCHHAASTASYDMPSLPTEAELVASEVSLSGTTSVASGLANAARP